LRSAGGEEWLDEEHAATRVIVETFTAIGVQTMTGDRPAHVRVPRRFLLEQHAFALPPARVVLEVADPDPIDGALHAGLERLVDQRYRISFACNPRARIPVALMDLADSVKLDITGLTAEEIAACGARFRPETATLIAAGVDTPALLEQCTEAGF